MSDHDKPAIADRPIETVQRVQRRAVLMPRGQKNIAIRETTITLARVRCIEPKDGGQ